MVQVACLLTGVRLALQLVSPGARILPQLTEERRSVPSRGEVGNFFIAEGASERSEFSLWARRLDSQQNSRS